MNKHFKLETLQELYAGLFVADAYKNFIPKYRALLTEQVADMEKVASTMPSVAAHDPDLIDASLTEVAELLSQVFAIFKLIVERPREKRPGADFVMMQRALHEYMLKTLYHINRNCRKLLEAQIDYEKFDALEDYLEYLKEKYDLLEEQMILVGQKWHDNDEQIFYSLVERENKLKTYDSETDGICLQVYNRGLDNQLKVPKEICTPNGLVISKRYFFYAIFRLFQHLQLITQLCELEKTGNATLETIEEEEIGTDLMKPFNQAAREIL